MKDRFDLTRGWLLKANSDILTAQRMLEGDGPYDTACFHTQQAVEKYLKSLFAFLGEPIPRTHNLEELQQASITLIPTLPLADFNLAELTPYAVELRYDFEFWPTYEVAVQALNVAEQVRQLIVDFLPSGILTR